MKIQIYISVFLFLALHSGCSTQQPALARYNLWNQALTVPSDVHMALVWSDGFAQKSGRPAADPEILVKTLSDACVKKSGRIASYQIFENADDVAAWIQVFRPSAPVLLVNAKLSYSESSGNWSIELEGKSRLQPLFFDTTQNAVKTSVQVSRKPQPPQPTGDAFARDLLKSSEEKLYSDFATKLFAELNLSDKKDTVLYYLNGKSDRMKRAYEAALGNDLKTAEKLWLEEAQADPENQKAFGNLSYFYESQGDFKKALEYHGFYSEKQPKGFRSLLQAEANLERAGLLSGIIAIKETSVPAKKAFKPQSTLAILPFENTTNDLDAPVRIRKQTAKEAQKLGVRLIDMDEIDDKMKKAGFTDAGQFRSTTLQKLGEKVGADYLLMGNVEEFRVLPSKEVKADFKLIYAPEGQTVYEKTIRILEEPKNIFNSILEKALAKAAEAVLEKAAGKTLEEESQMAARRYVRALPHFRN